MLGEVEVVEVLEVVEVSLLAWLSVLEKCSLVSVLLTSGPSTARPVVTELGLNLPPGRAEEISLQAVKIIARVRIIVIVRVIVSVRIILSGLL